jgi:hypothetical protein
MLNKTVGYRRSRLDCTSTLTDIIPNRPGPIISLSFALSFDAQFLVVEILSGQHKNKGLFRGRHTPRRILGPNGAAEQFVLRYNGYYNLRYRYIGETTG